VTEQGSRADDGTGALSFFTVFCQKYNTFFRVEKGKEKGDEKDPRKDLI